MASTKLDVTSTAWVEIMPLSDTAYCVANAPFGVKFKQSATQPALGDTEFSVAYGGDIITGSATSPIWGLSINSNGCKVVRHD